MKHIRVDSCLTIETRRLCRATLAMDEENLKHEELSLDCFCFVFSQVCLNIYIQYKLLATSVWWGIMSTFYTGVCLLLWNGGRMKGECQKFVCFWSRFYFFNKRNWLMNIQDTRKQNLSQVFNCFEFLLGNKISWVPKIVSIPIKNESAEISSKWLNHNVHCILLTIC